MLGYLALGAGAVVGGRLLWIIDDWKRDWSSNHARWTENHRHETMRPIITDKDIDETESVIRDWVESQSEWDGLDTVADEAEPYERRLHLIHRTSVFRFIDDVHVQLKQIRDAEGIPRIRIDAESQSRIGRGDLGQNPRNLQKLHSGISKIQVL